jgi:outer membrane protein assembly factor BamB
VVAVVLQWLAWFVVPLVEPEAVIYGMATGVICAVAIVVWWLLFSRAPWVERLGAIVLMIAALWATMRVVHPSIAGGMMGNMLYVYSMPTLSMALVAGAVLSRGRSDGLRRTLIAACILIACGVFTLLRTDGVIGAGSLLAWRWSPSAEERLLAEVKDEPLPVSGSKESGGSETSGGSKEQAPPYSTGAADKHEAVNEESGRPPTTTAAHVAEWPGFRGANRDGVVRGVRIETDWAKSPPKELWRRPIGPGWSSFAVDGDLLYTQEQRGDDEIVAAYKVSTGEPVWRHRDPVRFWESNGGAGPRATPTISNGRVYAFGATGILNALDAKTGALVWSRNVAAETHTETPGWGFTSSPVVADDVVIVAVDATVVGYDVASGKQRWVGPHHRGSYSSPQRVTIDGVDQVLMLGGGGAVSLAPATGTLLWEHKWQGMAIVQPAVMPNGDVLINIMSAMGGIGIRRISASRESEGWTVEERWTSNGLKPYFNDFVVHKGYAYGFDGAILAAINLEDGKRAWKGGRYGSGQLVVLADQDVLLVTSEEGELVLVSATPDQFKEIARIPAIQGKTWNHPVVIGDVLLVRNGEEMAAFRLPLAADR